MSSLYTLDINSLSDIRLANIFLQFSRLPFHFVDSYLCCAEAFKFDVVLLVYFYFVDVLFCQFKSTLVPSSKFCISVIVLMSSKIFISLFLNIIYPYLYSLFDVTLMPYLPLLL